MKKSFFLIGVTILLLISCTHNKQKNLAVIKGTVPKETNSLKFERIKEHTADMYPKKYFVQIDSSGNFEIEIPVQQLSVGVMNINDKRYDFAIAPNDQIEIKVDKDNIIYSGKGAEKNNFLYELSKNDKCSLDGIINSWYNENHELKDFFVMIDDYINSRKKEFEKFNKLYPLGADYTNYFQIENELVYIDLYQYAITAYAIKNNLPISSVNIPQEYKKQFNLKSLQDDKNLIYRDYLTILDNIIYSNMEKIISKNNSINPDSLTLSIAMDSLSGQTREHYLVKSIYYDLCHDKYDSTLMSSFNKIKSNKNCISFVNKELEKFNKKKEMIGVNLSSEILKTELRDTSNNKKTLADILKKYKGNVIYLDIWSLGCGPCREAMPFSKKIKEKLKGYPVEFVYITVDEYSDILWKEVFEVSLGKENHYRFEKGFGAKLLEAFSIIAVPTYLMFDKEGKLLSYKAERPFNNMMQENPELERILIALSGNM
ncbi:MAG: TlpA family protein disulfide reductase [Ignavibacteria bacterium]|nr:TlpA family protein disulfide reductase [Ignavibacteria bacterium]